MKDYAKTSQTQHCLESQHRSLTKAISDAHIKESLIYKILLKHSSKSAISRRQVYFLSGNNKLVNRLKSQCRIISEPKTDGISFLAIGKMPNDMTK